MCYVAIGVAIRVGHSTICCIPICACLQIHLEVLEQNTRTSPDTAQETTSLLMAGTSGEGGSRMVQHHQGQAALVE